MSKADCSIVRDLMPLCIDGAASKESQRLVEAHTADCCECAEMYSEMHRELPDTETKADEAALEHAAKSLRFKRKIRALWAVILSMAALMIVLVANAAQVAKFVDDAWFRLRYVGPDNQLRLDAFNAELGDNGWGLERLRIESSPCGNRPFQPDFQIWYDEKTGEGYLQIRLIATEEESNRWNQDSEDFLYYMDVYGYDIYDFNYDTGYYGSKMYYEIHDDDWNHLENVEIHWIELVCGDEKQELWRLGESFPAVWKDGVLTKSDEPLPTATPRPAWQGYTVYSTPTPTPTPAPTFSVKPRLPPQKR